MSVAEHLGIKTSEYDQQILTFIPHYADILDAAAGALDALDRPARLLVDLGTGSGALAGRCVKRLRGVRVVGIDSDAAMLAMARRRLGTRLTPVVGNFESAPIPACDVITASFSLHHVASPEAKRAVFARAFASLRPGGMLVDADCVLNADAAAPEARSRGVAAAPGGDARPRRARRSSCAPGRERTPTSRWTSKRRCCARPASRWTWPGGGAPSRSSPPRSPRRRPRR